MSNKDIVRKVFINKKNKQLNVPLSKKQLKSKDPTIKFDEDLFVKIEVLRQKKK